MFTLYKYRPLTDFLFKELYYNELYFATYPELNDPLDLTVNINFMPSSEEQLLGLLDYLVKVSLLYETRFNENDQKLFDFHQNDKLTNEFCAKLYKKIIETSSVDNFLPYKAIENHIVELSNDYNIRFKVSEFNSEIQRLTNIFFENSYTTCFSKTNSDFLMWSHYASKHSGICIEFSLYHENHFPFIVSGNRERDTSSFVKRRSDWNIKQSIYWEKIHKITYDAKPPFISFYDFTPIFDNEGDVDLMNLSKSKWHVYAYELQKIYTIKTNPWSYEEEWRAIEIDFKRKESEERIRHYPIEAISSIYFGLRTPEDVKKRIYSIMKKRKAEIKYFNTQLTNERDLSFEEWYYYKE